MSILQINLAPTDRQLRQFGVACFVALPAIGWLWGVGGSAMTALAVTGLLLAIAGLLFPRLLKPVFLLLTLVAAPVGMVMGELAMLVIYFGIALPIGLTLRMLRRVPLQLELDRERETYWEKKERSKDVANYYRQS